MKNKNIKNKPKNGVDGFSCILDFQTFSGGGPPNPLIKGIHKLNPQNLTSTTTTAEGKKEPESPSPLKQSTRNLSLGYTEIEKRRRAQWAKIFFVWFVIGLFETLICAIAEDKVCDSCIVSFWALLIFLLCDDQIQISCAVWLRKMENLAVTFCYLWLTEKLWLLRSTAPKSPPLKH